MKKTVPLLIFSIWIQGSDFLTNFEKSLNVATKLSFGVAVGYGCYRLYSHLYAPEYKQLCKDQKIHIAQLTESQTRSLKIVAQEQTSIMSKLNIELFARLTEIVQANANSSATEIRQSTQRITGKADEQHHSLMNTLEESCQGLTQLLEKVNTDLSLLQQRQHEESKQLAEKQFQLSVSTNSAVTEMKPVINVTNENVIGMKKDVSEIKEVLAHTQGNVEKLISLMKQLSQNQTTRNNEIVENE
jgi:hypothetical protein